MALATVGAGCKPSARMVLLKGFDEGGFYFYTNYRSRKGRELEENPHTALVFFWQPISRQVRIEGVAGRISRRESREYFGSRPPGHRLGALASPQSRVIESRHELDRRFRELESLYQETGEVSLPEYWGGYRLVPGLFEFWQERPNRLHDRFRYLLQDGVWTIERLAP